MSAPKTSTQTVAERRAAEAQVSALIEKIAPAHVSLVGAARRALRKRLPSAFEVAYEYRDWIVLSFSPSEKGYEGVLAIRADADGVRLCFHAGKSLADPEKLLKGSGSLVRWMELESAAALARPAVKRLIDAAIAQNRVPFARTGRGPVLVRPAAARKRTPRPG